MCIRDRAFDVAHGAADLDDGHVRGVVAFGQGKHGALDLVGDVGDHLHGAAQVIAPAFLGDHVVVDGTGSSVVLARHGHVEVTLVVAQVPVSYPHLHPEFKSRPMAAHPLFREVIKAAKNNHKK